MKQKWETYSSLTEGKERRFCRSGNARNPAGTRVPASSEPAALLQQNPDGGPRASGFRLAFLQSSLRRPCRLRHFAGGLPDFRNRSGGFCPTALGKLLWVHLFLLLMLYFVWFWVNGGQTLAMKT